MILIIDMDPQDVIFRSEGRIVIKLPFYTSFAKGIHLESADQEKYDKPENVEVRRKGTLYVGPNGGLTLEK